MMPAGAGQRKGQCLPLAAVEREHAFGRSKPFLRDAYVFVTRRQVPDGDRRHTPADAVHGHVRSRRLGGDDELGKGFCRWLTSVVAAASATAGATSTLDG